MFFTPSLARVERPSDVKNRPNVARIDGTPSSGVLYFLPWGTPFHVARACGLLPLPFRACYETPAHIVNPSPDVTVQVMLDIVRDARAIVPSITGPILIVAYSMGNFPATKLAARVGATFISVCGAARGEDLLWESPAAAEVKREAILHGHDRRHFMTALRGHNPADQLCSLRADTQFIVAERDRLIPAKRTAEWTNLIRERVTQPRIISMPCGHLRAHFASRAVQFDWRAKMM